MILDLSIFKERISIKHMGGNRIGKTSLRISEERIKRFRYLYNKYGINKATDYVLNNHYDVCIVGCWNIRNFGSHLTYYSLYKLLNRFNKETIFLGCPKDAPYKSGNETEYFKVNPYNSWDIAEQFSNKIEMRGANDLADCFVVGSDQVWNDKLYYYFGEFAFLDFIHDSKNKIAYATSFGKDTWDGSKREKEKIGFYLNRFDKISVRELSGIDICYNDFHVNAKWVLDPILLLPKSEYDILADKSEISKQNGYVFAYILDYTPEKEELVEYIANTYNMPYWIVTDPNIPLNCGWKSNPLSNISVEDWISLIKDCSFMVTDSFHGMCMSLVYERQFLAVINSNRGAARFIDYGKALNIETHLIDMAENYLERFKNLDEINYQSINAILRQKAKEGSDWLYDAVHKVKDNPISEFDMISIKLDNQNLKKKRENPIKRTLIWNAMRYLKSNGFRLTFARAVYKIKSR